MQTSKTIHFKVILLLGLSVLVLSFSCYNSSKAKNEIKNNPIVKTEIVPQSKQSLRDSIINFGKEFLGTPYVTASCSKDGFDCSGFVYFVFQHYKIKVPRSSIEFGNFGKEVPIEKVKKGDVLVFLSPTRNVIGHIGIVTNPNGMESDFIQASSSKEMKVMISSLKQKGYTKRFVKAVDVIDLTR